LASRALPRHDRARARTGSVAAALTLDEGRLNNIIDVLAAATNSVPSGRRDLYLALPGALLDRGVDPDNVLAIVEAVSASYPRSHPEKHADNMHNARTTIAKREAGENYTRIGTLNTVAPSVAAALDSVLPDLAAKMIADSMEEMLKLPSAPVEPAPGRRRQPKPKLDDLGKKISAIAKRLKDSKNDTRRLAGILITCFVNGDPLPVSPVGPDTQVDDHVATAMRAIGRNLDVTVATWQAVLDFASRSLSLMDFIQSVERVAAAERAFYEGHAKRRKANMKKTAKLVDIKRRDEDFYAVTRKGS
jgi:hypothetical protein